MHNIKAADDADCGFQEANEDDDHS